MSQTAYPKAAQLKRYLQAAGLTLTAAMDEQLQQNANAAAADFERTTGRRFVAPTVSPAARQFDPPTVYDDGRCILYFDQDLAVTPTPTISYQPKGSTAATWTLGTEYEFLPNNASEAGLPYDSMQIYGRRYLKPLSRIGRKSIYITGSWYWGNVPDNVWNGIMARAAWLSYPLLAYSLQNGVIRWQGVEGVSQTYSEEPLKALRMNWGGDSEDGCGGQYGRATRLYWRYGL